MEVQNPLLAQSQII